MPSDAAVGVKRRVKVGQRKTQVHVVEAFLAASLTIDIDDGAVGDRDIAKADVVQQARRTVTVISVIVVVVIIALGVAGFGGVEFPIGFAVGVDLKPNSRRVEDKFIYHEVTAQQREQTDLQAQGAEFDHVGIGGSRDIGDGDLLEGELNRRNDRNTDIAGDRDLSPGGVFNLIFDLGAQGVFRHQRRQNQNDNNKNDDKCR